MVEIVTIVPPSAIRRMTNRCRLLRWWQVQPAGNPQAGHSGRFENPRAGHPLTQAYRPLSIRIWSTFGPRSIGTERAVAIVDPHSGEWEATLYLAQPLRHNNGVWAVTRVGDPVS
jgi:hypothetical protein